MKTGREGLEKWSPGLTARDKSKLLAPDCPPGHCVLLRKERGTDHLTLEIPLPLLMSMNIQELSWIHMQTLVPLEGYV